MRTEADAVSARTRREQLSLTRIGRESGPKFARAARNVSYVCAALLGLGYAVATITFAVQGDYLAFDFKGTLWDPAIAIREGASPYPAPTEREVDVGNPALYPPLLMLGVTPLTFLPWPVGAAIWIGVLGLSVVAALYALDVRDWRCYVFALIASPTVIGLGLANAGLLLVPLVALAWRWREQWARCGIIVGLAIASKLFLWPLLVWLLGTRRYRALGVAMLACGLGVLLPWALIGFSGLSAYPDLLRLAEELYAGHSYSVATMLSAIDDDPSFAVDAVLALGLAIAVASFYVGRRTPDCPTAISLALLAAVLGSPIVWPHYYALLLVPIAIARPRFAGLWVALSLFWVANRIEKKLFTESDLEAREVCCPPDGVHVGVWLFNHSPPALWPAVGYASVGVVLVAMAISSTRRSSAPA